MSAYTAAHGRGETKAQLERVLAQSRVAGKEHTLFTQQQPSIPRTQYWKLFMPNPDDVHQQKSVDWDTISRQTQELESDSEDDGDEDEYDDHALIGPDPRYPHERAIDTHEHEQHRFDLETLQKASVAAAAQKVDMTSDAKESKQKRHTQPGGWSLNDWIEAVSSKAKTPQDVAKFLPDLEYQWTSVIADHMVILHGYPRHFIEALVHFVQPKLGDILQDQVALSARVKTLHYNTRNMVRGIVNTLAERGYDLPKRLSDTRSLEPDVMKLVKPDKDPLFDKYTAWLLELPSSHMHSGFTGQLWSTKALFGPIPVLIVSKLARILVKTSSRMYENAVADAMDQFQSFSITSTEGPARISYMEVGALLQLMCMEIFVWHVFEQTYRLPMLTCANGKCGGTVDVDREKHTAVCMRCGYSGIDNMALLLVPFGTFLLQKQPALMNVHMEFIPQIKGKAPPPPEKEETPKASTRDWSLDDETDEEAMKQGRSKGSDDMGDEKIAEEDGKSNRREPRLTAAAAAAAATATAAAGGEAHNRRQHAIRQFAHEAAEATQLALEAIEERARQEDYDLMTDE